MSDLFQALSRSERVLRLLSLPRFDSSLFCLLFGSACRRSSLPFALLALLRWRFVRTPVAEDDAPPPTSPSPPRPRSPLRAPQPKESGKWVQLIRKSERLRRRARVSVPLRYVLDAEAADYQVFHYGLRHNVPLIVRLRSERNVAEKPGKLWSFLAQRPSLGRDTFELAAAHGRPARQVEVEMRASAVTLQDGSHKHSKVTVRRTTS